MLSYQKKAEEAHRILEGLGPRVELVSGLFDFVTYFCFCIICVSLFSFCIHFLEFDHVPQLYSSCKVITKKDVVATIRLPLILFPLIFKIGAFNMMSIGSQRFSVLLKDTFGLLDSCSTS